MKIARVMQFNILDIQSLFGNGLQIYQTYLYLIGLLSLLIELLNLFKSTTKLVTTSSYVQVTFI